MLADGLTVYQLKKDVKEGKTAAGASSAQEAQAKLNEIIKDQNKKLATTPVFGSDVAKDKNLVVKNDVDLGDFIVKVNPKTIDVAKTYKLRTKNSTPLVGEAQVQYRQQIENELGFGIHSLTKEQRSENGKRGGKIGGEKGGRRVYELGVGAHGRTKEKMSEDGKRGGRITYENKIGIHGRTKEEMTENGRKCGYRTYELGIGIHGQSKEQMTENGRKGGKIGGKLGSKEDKSKAAKKANSQRWICLETGYVSNAGGLSNYQRVRGIDTSKRKRME